MLAVRNGAAMAIINIAHNKRLNVFTVLSVVLTTAGVAVPGNSETYDGAATVTVRPAEGVSRLTLSSTARERMV